MDLVGKGMSLLFNMLSRLVRTFLPRSKHLLISWLQSPSAVILEPKKTKSLTVSTVSPSICHGVMGPDAMILVFWMLSFKPTFSFSFSLLSKDSLVLLYFLPKGGVRHLNLFILIIIYPHSNWIRHILALPHFIKRNSSFKKSGLCVRSHVTPRTQFWVHLISNDPQSTLFSSGVTRTIPNCIVGSHMSYAFLSLGS